MEKRVVLAVILMTAVILISNLLFPPLPPEEPEAPAAAPETLAPAAPALAVPRTPAPAATMDTLVVRTPLGVYAVSTRGAALVRVELAEYPSYTRPEAHVQLVPPGVESFLAHRVVVGADTLDLHGAPFRAQASAAALNVQDAPYELRLSYGDGTGVGAEVMYTFHPDRYVVGVRGRIHGLNGAPALLLTDLGTGLEPHEHPAHRSERQLAVVGRNADGVQNLRMEKVRGTQRIEGPLAWVGVKDKYFLAALVAPPGTPGFARVQAWERPEGTYTIPRGAGLDTLPVPQAQTVSELALGPDGSFAFDAFLGPQDYALLAQVGQGLQEVNPYGYRWLRPVVRPIAAAILWVLNLLHNTLGIGYGWVLVLFGVLMRILLWPLNAKAMRAQLKNMAVQPLMQEMREKHKDDPQRMQQEMIKLYREHGFNPLAGCLPLLIPMPVLITLFFVFQDSIVFRGEEFFWLPDLSLADPYYILPLFLVVSMFALQWVSFKMSGMEQNPQMKMMMYVLPLFMGFIFFMLPSGLNLYYATTNVATIPQQLLISKERRRAQEALKEQQEAAKAASSPPTRPPGGRGGARKRKAKRRS